MKKRNGFQRIKHKLFFPLIILFVGQCGNNWNPFNPEEAVQTRESLTRLADPKSVIIKLQDAYSERELNDYLNCLSEDFIFILNQDDYAYFQLKDNWWGKYTEEQAHRNLFEQSSDLELKLTFLSSTKLEEERYKLKYQYQLNVYIIDTRYIADGYAEFEVVKIDNQWKIQKWQDMLY